MYRVVTVKGGGVQIKQQARVEEASRMPVPGGEDRLRSTDDALFVGPGQRMREPVARTPDPERRCQEQDEGKDWVGVFHTSWRSIVGDPRLGSQQASLLVMNGLIQSPSDMMFVRGEG